MLPQPAAAPAAVVNAHGSHTSLNPGKNLEFYKNINTLEFFYFIKVLFF